MACRCWHWQLQQQRLLGRIRALRDGAYLLRGVGGVLDATRLGLGNGVLGRGRGAVAEGFAGARQDATAAALPVLRAAVAALQKTCMRWVALGL